MSTVTFHHIGRLGNGLFQCAAAIGYAKKHGMRWVCPTNTGEVPRFHEFFPNLPIEDYYYGERYEAHDPSMFNYREIPHFPHGVKLIGFFQSEKYFKHAEQEVREAFKLKEYPELKDYTACHIRRGDYVQYSNSFPPVDYEYVCMANEKLEEMTGKFQRILFFSDDPQWLKEHFSNWHGCEIVEGNDEFTDLSMMASCAHNIIANSTFSWMAAWLNKNPDKIVVSPHHTSWFGASGPNKTEDLIPESWTQIKFR